MIKIGLNLCALIGLSACAAIAPANTPPHLDYTPGPAIVITDQTYNAGPFFLRYPQGWRVITAAAFSTPWVVLTTPDETTLIALALDRQDTRVVPANTPEGDLRRQVRVLSLDSDQLLYAALVAPRNEWETYTPVFDRVIATVATQQDD